MIFRFRGSDAFLSNSYECKVDYSGYSFHSAESAYQSQKCKNKLHITKFLDLSAKESLELGKQIEIASDWEEKKERIMQEILDAKFTQNIELRDWLIATEENYLLDSNIYHDNYWGFCMCSSCTNIAKSNKLGDILMKTREKLIESFKTHNMNFDQRNKMC